MSTVRFAGEEDTARRPAHVAVARVAFVAPIAAAVTTLAELAYQAARGERSFFQVDFTLAGALTTAVLLAFYLLVEEAARDRTRGRALAMFVAAAVFNLVFLHTFLGALWGHLLGYAPSQNGDWLMLALWDDVARSLEAQWATLWAPALLAGVPLLVLGVARGVLRLAGWAQLLVVTAGVAVSGAVFGLCFAIKCGYPPEVWGISIAAGTGLVLPGWVAVPFALRVGERPLPWIARRLTVSRARSSA